MFKFIIVTVLVRPSGIPQCPFVQTNINSSLGWIVLLMIIIIAQSKNITKLEFSVKSSIIRIIMNLMMMTMMMKIMTMISVKIIIRIRITRVMAQHKIWEPLQCKTVFNTYLSLGRSNQKVEESGPAFFWPNWSSSDLPNPNTNKVTALLD